MASFANPLVYQLGDPYNNALGEYGGYVDPAVNKTRGPKVLRADRLNGRLPAITPITSRSTFASWPRIRT